jgi:hypothetical protein
VESRFIAVLATLLIGCAGSQAAATGPATTTGAELPRPASAEASPAAAASLPGQLACRTKGPSGLTELFLDWNGDSAKGTLHSVTPSGMVYDTRVTAERGDNGLVIVDEPGNSDLVCHAAVIVPQNGKKHMRLGGPHGSHEASTQPWLDCE